MTPQRSEGAVLPEVETACDFHITAAGSLVHALGILGIVVIVDEEEGVAPVVIVETLEGCGEMVPVPSEIVEGLEVGLCFCANGECAYSDCCNE